MICLSPVFVHVHIFAEFVETRKLLQDIVLALCHTVSRIRFNFYTSSLYAVTELWLMELNTVHVEHTWAHAILWKLSQPTSTIFSPLCSLETGRSTANGFLVSVDYWTSGMTLFFSFVHISRSFISTIRYLHINMQDEEQDFWY